jgi:hypothetical protein
VIDVDAQDLAQQRRLVLRARLRIVARSSVAHADVEVAVRTELERAAVVIRIGLRDDEEDLRGRGIRRVRRGGRRGVARDDGRAVRRARVVDEELPVGGVLRMEHEP